MTYREFRAEVGSRIRAARVKRNLSRFKLGEAAGLTISDILTIERGYRIPTVKTLIMICERLDVPLADIFAGLPTPELTPEQRQSA